MKAAKRFTPGFLFLCLLLGQSAAADFSSSRGVSSSAFVTAEHYAHFLNAVAATDAHHLYDEKMGLDKIMRTGTPGEYRYYAMQKNAPITYVSWNDAARYCNWMENDRLTLEADCEITEYGVYELREEELLSINEQASHLLVAHENASAVFAANESLSSWGSPASIDEPSRPIIAIQQGAIFLEKNDWLKSNRIGFALRGAASACAVSGNAAYEDGEWIGGGLVLAALLFGGGYYTRSSEREVSSRSSALAERGRASDDRLAAQSVDDSREETSPLGRSNRMPLKEREASESETDDEISVIDDKKSKELRVPELDLRAVSPPYAAAVKERALQEKPLCSRTENSDPNLKNSPTGHMSLQNLEKIENGVKMHDATGLKYLFPNIPEQASRGEEVILDNKKIHKILDPIITRAVARARAIELEHAYHSKVADMYSKKFNKFLAVPGAMATLAEWDKFMPRFDLASTAWGKCEIMRQAQQVPSCLKIQDELENALNRLVRLHYASLAVAPGASTGKTQDSIGITINPRSFQYMILKHSAYNDVRGEIMKQAIASVMIHHESSDESSAAKEEQKSVRLEIIKSKQKLLHVATTAAHTASLALYDLNPDWREAVTPENKNIYSYIGFLKARRDSLFACEQFIHSATKTAVENYTKLFTREEAVASNKNISTKANIERGRDNRNVEQNFAQNSVRDFINRPILEEFLKQRESQEAQLPPEEAAEALANRVLFENFRKLDDQKKSSLEKNGTQQELASNVQNQDGKNPGNTNKTSKQKKLIRYKSYFRGYQYFTNEEIFAPEAIAAWREMYDIPFLKFQGRRWSFSPESSSKLGQTELPADNEEG